MNYKDIFVSVVIGTDILFSKGQNYIQISSIYFKL